MNKKFLIHLSIITISICTYSCKLDPPIYPTKPITEIEPNPVLYVSTIVSGKNNLIKPSRLCTTKNGTIYLTSYTAGIVYKVTPTGIVSKVIQDVKKPLGIKSDASGNIYVLSVGENRLLKFDTNGELSTVKISEDINAAQDFAISDDGIIYIADTGNRRILKVEQSGSATTLAGKSGVTGTRDGTGANSYFNSPTNIRLASDGFLWVIDGDVNKKTGQAIRRITSKGQVNTYYVQKDKNVAILDLTPAKRDKEFKESDIVSLFLVSDNNSISHLSTSGVKTELVKTSSQGFKDGILESSQFSNVSGISINAGNMYVVDQGNEALRVINTTKSN